MKSNQKIRQKLRQKLKKQDGFTLVEVITVVFLIGTLLAMEIPSVQQTFYRIELDTAIQRLHKDIRWAQQLAEREQTKVTIKFLNMGEYYKYTIKATDVPGYFRETKLPKSFNVSAKTISIKADKTFTAKDCVEIRKGDIRRYVIYYSTGRSRISAVKDD